MARIWLTLGAVTGFLAVAVDAFAAHALQARLDAAALDWMATAAGYHFNHALALLAVGILGLWSGGGRRSLNLAGIGFTVGLIGFSGGLYFMALTGSRALGWIVPLGGFGFLVGWAALAVAVLGMARTPRG